MTSLLVTNDFPPKFGGIQSYLYELWRRLPPAETTVLTTPHAGAAEWDAEQAFRVERVREPVLLPDPDAGARASTRSRARSAPTSMFLDPALPLGLARAAAARRAVGRRAPRRGGHGARAAARESHRMLGRVLRGAARRRRRGGVPGARGGARGGHEPARRRDPAGRRRRAVHARSRRRRSAASERIGLGLDPGPADGRRGQPAGAAQGLRRPARRGRAARARRAARDRGRRPRSQAARDRVRTGSVSATASGSSGGCRTTTLPAVYRGGDVFAMMCRERWGGLEAEGFGIVFLEAGGERGARRSRGAAAARTRRWSTARPGSSSTPTT